MNEQILIEEQAHFYVEEATIVELYVREKEKQGYNSITKRASPKGYIVESSIWIAI